MRVFLTPIFVVWAGFVVVADAAVAYGVRTAVRSADWVPADGVVTRSELRTVRKSLSLDLAYTYTADGREHTGRDRQPGPVMFPNKTLRQAHAALPVGTRVTVYHNPVDPAEAVLVPGLKPDVLLMLLALTPFNVIAAGLGWAWWAAVTRRRQFDPARDVRPTADGYAARLNGFGPAGVFAIAVLAQSFAGIFLVIVLLHGAAEVPASWAVDGGIWAGILAVCGLFAWRYRQPRAVVEGLDTLTVPTTPTGRETTRVPRHEVRAVGVKADTQVVFGGQTRTVTTRSVTRTTKEYKRPVFVVTLTLDPARRQPELAFAQYPEQADAEAVAEWVRERLSLPV
jgi:hypothetical protein